MKPLLLLVTQYCLMTQVLYCQNEKIDSLKNALHRQKADTNKVSTLNALSYQYRNIQPDTGLLFGQEALSLAQNLNWQAGIAKAYKYIGNNYCSLGSYDTAMNFSQKSLKLNEQINNKEGIAENFMLMGSIYQNLSEYLKALEYFRKALNLYEQLDHKKGIGKNLNNLGIIYEILGDYPKALQTFLKGVKLCEQLGDEEELAIAFSNLGILYTDAHDYPKALDYCNKSMNISVRLGIKAAVAACLGSIAAIYSYSSDYKRSLEYNSKALVIAREMNDKLAIARTLVDIGIDYLYLFDYAKALDYNQQSYKLNEQIGAKSEMSINLFWMGYIYFKADDATLEKVGIPVHKRYIKAIDNLNASLGIARKIGNLDQQKQALEALTMVYEKKGEIKKAYTTYKNYVEVSDSLFNTDKKNEIIQKQLQYEYDKKESLAQAEQYKRNALAAAEIRNQKLVRNFSLISAFALISFASVGFYRYRRRRQLQSQQEMLNERLRISRELHDEVGATLSGIAMYSHLTKEQIKQSNTTEVEKSLNIMQQSAGEMVNKLNDIVWLVNPEQDSLKKLIQRLEEYARDMTSIKNMQVKINIPENLHEHSLLMEDRRNIYLFCKEAINNAIKYSSGTLLELTIKETNKTLEFSVTDNGKGFDVENVKRGNGLNNMQKRADEIRAKLTVQSKQNEGSLVSMHIEIT